MSDPTRHWSREMRENVEAYEAKYASEAPLRAQHRRELRGRHSRSESLPRPATAIGPSISIANFSRTKFKESVAMLSKSEVAVRAHFMKPGTVEQHAAARSRRGELYPDATSKFEPHDSADGDDARTPIEMTHAECMERARNLMDSVDEDDDMDVDSKVERLNSASRHLALAAAKLRNPNSRVHSVTFVR